MTEILGLIPARGGSKGIPQKNSRPLAGQPLIMYTLQAAQASKHLTRRVLTTDSPRIAAIGRQAGVSVPFLRPAEFAQDNTPMVATIQHTLDWLATHENYHPEIVVLLQPTAPLRTAAQIDEAIVLLQSQEVDAVVSVSPVPGHYSPYWQFNIKDGLLHPFVEGAIISRRQDLPVTYTRNGAIYAFYTNTFQRYGNLYGERCAAYVIPASVNIDSPQDWALAEQLIREATDGNT